MEQREKDYQIAVEIGKMLLDKNKELEDKNDEMKTQYTLLVILRVVSHLKSSSFKKEKMNFRLYLMSTKLFPKRMTN